MTPPAACPDACSVRRCVAMAHVVDVERSVAFYSLLGFERKGVVKDVSGRTNWARIVSHEAEMMFARADEEPVAEHQAVLFYMYSMDVAALRNHLLASGLHDGSRYTGQAGANEGGSVFDHVAVLHATGRAACSRSG